MPPSINLEVSPGQAEAVAPAERTINLAAMAGISPGDRVVLQPSPDKTAELFDHTIDLLQRSNRHDVVSGPAKPRTGFIPQEEDLRSRFKLAEVLGSYATLNTLLDRYAPAFALTQSITGTASVAHLSQREIAMLEDYRAQIHLALQHASGQIEAIKVADFTLDELQELNTVLSEAKARHRALETVIGMRLIYDVEQAVDALYSLCEKISSVQRSITGVFFINSEIMFVPSASLVKIVDEIFRAIGNPFVVENIDGTLLLAARNMLIQVMSFYAYYGREQIYRLIGTDHGKNAKLRVAGQIKGEIRALFNACKANNKLVLTRVMENTEREFELSVEALQIEAANRAIAEVQALVPPKPVKPKAAPTGFLHRLSRWLFREAA